MNKVFFVLLILTLAGAGLLFWLLKSMPQSASPDQHAKDGGNLVIAKPDGVDVTGEAGKEGGGQAHEGEEAATTERASDEPVLKIETEPVKAVVFVDGEMIGQTPIELPLKAKEQQVKLEAHGFKEIAREAPAVKAGMDLDTLTWKIVMRAQPGSLKTSPRSAEPKTAAKAKAAEPKPVATEAKPKASETKTAATDPKAAATKTPTRAAKPAQTEEPAPPAADDEAAEPMVAARENPDDILFLSGPSGPVWVQIQAMPATSRASAEENIRTYRKALNLNVMGCEVEVAGKGRWVRVLTGPFDSKREAQGLIRSINSRLRDPGFVTGVQQCL